MKLTCTLAWTLGPLLAVAAAAGPAPSSQSQSQEQASAKLAELLQEIRIVENSQSDTEGGFPAEDLEVEEEVRWTLGMDQEETVEEEADFFITESESQRRLLIGIYTQEPTELLAYHLALPQDQAVVITGTVDDYPAERAGLNEHDVIVSVEGSNGATLDVLRRALDKKSPGDSLNLTVVQRGVRKELNIPLFLPEVEGKGLSAVFGSGGLEIEDVIEEEPRLERRYAREAARIRDLDRELRNQAMRAELEAQRLALQAELNALSATREALTHEVEIARDDAKLRLMEREQRLQDEYDRLAEESASMEFQLEDLERELDRTQLRYRLRTPDARGRTREEGRRMGAWLLESEDDEDEELGGSIIYFDEDNSFMWNDDDDEEEDDFDEEVFDRMDGFEDRLERIEDLLMQLVERTR